LDDGRLRTQLGAQLEFARVALRSAVTGSHRHPSVSPFQGAPGLPQLPIPLLDALLTIARADGRLPRHALHQQTLAGLLGRGLVVGSGHDPVELTPLGLRVLAVVGLPRIRQQAAARRGRVPTDPRGRVRWAG
jgi:hypothetical protein